MVRVVNKLKNIFMILSILSVVYTQDLNTINSTTTTNLATTNTVTNSTQSNLSNTEITLAITPELDTPRPDQVPTDINSLDMEDYELFEVYQEFLDKFHKACESHDMLKRFKIFKTNFQALSKKLNISDFDNQTLLSQMSEFMDISPEDFQKHYLTLNISEIPVETEKYFSNSTEENTNKRFLQAAEAKVPDSWDWRKWGAVSPVKNQGVCGSCWAFSAISNLESIYYIKTGKLPILSVQQLVDCDRSNSGCLGGIMHTAFHYIRDNGVAEARQYPYIYQDGYCQYNANKAKYSVRGYISAGTDDEEKIKEMVYNVGPLSITINARILQYYTGGIIDVDYDYCPYAPNHGVVIVGYGTTARGLDYWIIRNTYGPNWGEEGYFRIARGRGLCGVNQYVVSGVLN